MDEEGRAAWPEERPTERSLSLTSARAVKRCKVQAAEDDQEPEASLPGTRSHSISSHTTSTTTQVRPYSSADAQLNTKSSNQGWLQQICIREVFTARRTGCSGCV